MNTREGRKSTVRLTTLTLTTKIFIRPSLLSFLPSLCISALFPMPALRHLNSRHIWYVWIIYTAVISPLPSHQSGTIIKQNAQVNSNPAEQRSTVLMCVYTQTQLDPAACFRNALPDACCLQYLVSLRYASHHELINCLQAHTGVNGCVWLPVILCFFCTHIYGEISTCFPIGTYHLHKLTGFIARWPLSHQLCAGEHV